MEIVRTVAELRGWSRGERGKGHTVGLVPTMGALHAGHASLIEAARQSRVRQCCCKHLCESYTVWTE
jgi:pantoate--beta-alanine ligase